MLSLFQTHNNSNITAEMSAKTTNGTASFNLDACSSFAIPAKNPFAVIDMGSNSCRLCIFDKSLPGGKIKFVETCRMGEGFHANLEIQPDAFKRTISALEKFASICNERGIKRIFSFATATVREAINREIFISACEKIGLQIHILSESQEALCGFLGTCCGLEDISSNIAVFDIGGASTEIAIGNFADFKGLFHGARVFPTYNEIIEKSKGTYMGLSKSPISFAHSFKVGAVRMTDMFSEDFISLRGYLENMFSNFKCEISLENTKCFGIGGTITSLCGILKGCENFKPELHGFLASFNEIEALTHKIENMGKIGRKSLPYLKEKRKEIIACGSEILSTAMACFKSQDITVSLSDNLEGYCIYLGLKI